MSHFCCVLQYRPPKPTQKYTPTIYGFKLVSCCARRAAILSLSPLPCQSWHAAWRGAADLTVANSINLARFCAVRVLLASYGTRGAKVKARCGARTRKVATAQCLAKVMCFSSRQNRRSFDTRGPHHPSHAPHKPTSWPAAFGFDSPDSGGAAPAHSHVDFHYLYL